jgi:hypothetical protein
MDENDNNKEKIFINKESINLWLMIRMIIMLLSLIRKIYRKKKLKDMKIMIIATKANIV